MADFDEFDDKDDLVLAYLDQEQQQHHQPPCDIPSPTQQDPAACRNPTPPTPAKRDRKRSHSSSPAEAATTVVRSMRPKIKVERLVDEGCSAAALADGRLQALQQEIIGLGSESGEDSLSLCEKKGGICRDEEEETVIWPPSQTFASDALKLQGSTTDHRQAPVNAPGKTQPNKATVKRETSSSLDIKPMRTKATGKNLSIKRDEDGNVTETGKKAITKHLLNTLGDKHNPITNSDLYKRTAHVVSCATGHQVAQRAGSKFSISEKSYFTSRNAKLRQQFTAQAREGLRVAEGAERSTAGSGVGPAVGIGGRFGAELSKSKGEGNDGEMSGSPMVQQSRIFAGLTFYLNGYTGPRISDLELKRLIAVHGGNVSYLANSSCTHVLITKNLSASKTQKFLDSASSIRGGKRKVVHVDWVLDSVAQRKRLDETSYNVIVNKAQPTLMATLGAVKKSVPLDTSLKPSGKARGEPSSELTDRKQSMDLTLSAAFVLVSLYHLLFPEIIKAAGAYSSSLLRLSILQQLSTMSTSNIHVVSHPLVQSKLTTLRVHDLPGKDFRDGIKFISSMLVYEASKQLSTEQVPGSAEFRLQFQLQSPIAEFSGTIISQKIGLVPILRAGIGMTDAMIATANTIIAALSTLKDWGVPMSHIKVVCVLGSKQGIERVATEFPEVEVWTAAMDPDLTSEGYISPGLGDAGDRLFNTFHE
ncbi:hypothetical protein QFC21_006827 [Naganishia friedmannii]|uniref:Uncharacterized protein n=1 Tax=Naganishia friedmannii TaxID=89922 RepID=A0ACC2V0I8_9TREE|nr:hypothetical protein QFC21_006827 [Naganishia friedmannii]